MSKQTPVIDKGPFTPKRAVWTAIGLCASTFGLTLLYFSMRVLMTIGGFCASGGPYVIAVECPDNFEWAVPLAIFSMIIGIFVYMGSRAKDGPDWSLLWWSALFLSLGWNFLEFGMNPPEGEGLVWPWLFCALMFGVFGLVPFLLIGGGGGFPHPLFGRESQETTGIMTGLESRGSLLFLHFGSAIAGIVIGFLVIHFVS